MKKPLITLAATAIMATNAVPLVSAEEVDKTNNDGVSIILEEPAGLIEVDKIAEIRMEKYFGGEQGQIVRFYEFGEKEIMAAKERDTLQTKGYYQEINIPQSIVKKIDKLPEEERLIEAKKLLIDYYKEIEYWSGMVILLNIDVPEHPFLNITVKDEMLEKMTSDQKELIDEIKGNKKVSVSKEDKDFILSFQTDMERVNNKLRTEEMVLEKAKEQYEEMQENNQEKGLFIPIAIFAFISVLVGFTLLTRR